MRRSRGMTAWAASASTWAPHSHPLEWMRIGVALKDFATEVGSNEQANEVPWDLRGGMSIMPIAGLHLRGRSEQGSGRSTS